MGQLTQQLVDKLVTTTTKPKLVYDGEVRGFCVRLTPRADGVAGATYAFDYYDLRGKKRRLTIGSSAVWSVDDARKKARKWRGMLDNEIDPKEERDAKKDEPTFSELAAKWLDYAETTRHKRESSLYDDRRMLGVLGVNEDGTLIADENPAMRKKRILTVLGEKRLTEIKQIDIARLHNSLKATPYQANRYLALLSSIFNYGVDQKWITENPTKGIIKFHEEKRRRLLTVPQVQKFLAALDAYAEQADSHRDAANALKLLLFTGSRVNEVLQATWEEIDFQNGLWVKPAEHTKQGEEEAVPLSRPVLKMLESMYYEGARGPLFPGKRGIGKDGKPTGGSVRVSLKRPWIQACKAAGLVEKEQVPSKDKDGNPRIDKNGNPILLDRYRPSVDGKSLRLHDWRHNFAGTAVNDGAPLKIVSGLIGHAHINTTERYSYVQTEAKREVADRVARIFTEVPKAGKRRA
jgi:integrase